MRTRSSSFARRSRILTVACALGATVLWAGAGHADAPVGILVAPSRGDSETTAVEVNATCDSSRMALFVAAGDAGPRQLGDTVPLGADGGGHVFEIGTWDGVAAALGLATPRNGVLGIGVACADDTLAVRSHALADVTFAPRGAGSAWSAAPEACDPSGAESTAQPCRPVPSTAAPTPTPTPTFASSPVPASPSPTAVPVVAAASLPTPTATPVPTASPTPPAASTVTVAVPESARDSPFFGISVAGDGAVNLNAGGPATEVQDGSTYLKYVIPALPAVSVTDTRPGALAWSVVGQLSNFDPGLIFGRWAGWQPMVVGTDNMGAVAGPYVAPGYPGTDSGLHSYRVLGSAPEGHGDSASTQATLTASLELRVPTTVPAGTYTAVLTLTAMS